MTTPDKITISQKCASWIAMYGNVAFKTVPTELAELEAALYSPSPSPSPTNRAQAIEEALKSARALIDENRQSIYDGYLVRYRGDPDYGGLDTEGKEVIAPYDEALATIDRALLTAAPPSSDRAQAIEECARKAEFVALDCEGGDTPQMTAYAIAARIRALLTTPQPTEEPLYLDALLWAWTNVTGRLPDRNTMTATEIEQYWSDYGEKIKGAVKGITGLEPDAYLHRRASGER